MKTFLFRSMIGIFFGAFIAVIIDEFRRLFWRKRMLDGQLFLKNSLGSIFCGWFFTVSPLYFENTNLRLSQQTALHFITVVILYFILAFGIGWIPFTMKSFLLTLGLFIVFLFYVLDCFLSLFQKTGEEIECGTEWTLNYTYEKCRTWLNPSAAFHNIYHTNIPCQSESPYRQRLPRRPKQILYSTVPLVCHSNPTYQNSVRP